MFEVLHNDKIINEAVNIGYIAMVIIVTIVLAKVAGALFSRGFARSSSFLKTDPTRYNFLRHFITSTIYTVGFAIAMYHIPPLRAISVSLFTGAGIFAAIIGLASQQAFSNIVGGIFIVLFRPFRVNDRLELREKISGVVEDITLRHTVLRSAENKRIIIPNSIIGQEIIVNANITDEKICRFIDFNISEESDVDLAMSVIQEQAMAHPQCIDVRTENDINIGIVKVDVKLIGFGDGAVNLRAFAWAKDPSSSFSMHCDLNKSIKRTFDELEIKLGGSAKTFVLETKEVSLKN